MENNMTKLKAIEKEVLEKLFNMRGGYVLDFTNRTFEEFFEDEFGVDIYDEKYNYGSGSKANRLRMLWRVESNDVVAKSIIKLIEYIRTKINLGDFNPVDYPEELIKEALKIANRLLSGQVPEEPKVGSLNASFKNGQIAIVLNNTVFSHIKPLLEDEHYFNAVEEAFKIVRNKLKQITGEERATDAFREQNYIKLFGKVPKNDSERDFFEGVKFLHMAIQFFRNEKAHTPSYHLDKNRAIHYIVLTSLAYELIDRWSENGEE